MATVPPASASTQEKRSAQRARATEFGVEALEGKGERLTFPAGFPTSLRDYGDPVNLMYPLVPSARARNARARFKQFARQGYTRDSSRKVVHTRIVQRLLANGASPSFDEDDPLDALLPAELKRRLRKAGSKDKGAMSKVRVTKAIQLEKGEELQQFIRKVQQAVWKLREKSSQYQNVQLSGIFDGEVLLHDWKEDKFFKTSFSRDDQGGIAIGEALREVRPVMVEVSQTQDRASTQGNLKVKKADDVLAETKVVQLHGDTCLIAPHGESAELVERLTKAALSVVKPEETELHELADESEAGFWKGVL